MPDLDQAPWAAEACAMGRRAAEKGLPLAFINQFAGTPVMEDWHPDGFWEEAEIAAWCRGWAEGTLGRVGFKGDET